MFLKDKGFLFITMADLLYFMKYRKGLPKKSVVITIDDGYRSVYEVAYPIMKKIGCTATLFIYTQFIGVGSSALTWKQIREMKRAGFEVGSHSLSHCDLTKRRSNESDADFKARIDREIKESKQIIDAALGQETRFFAFPYGRYNQRILTACEQAGYEIALTLKGGANPFFADPLSLRRIQVIKQDLKSFERRLSWFDEVSLK
jgi:peptidoglycan/xylan/chitin deacetylase (PgdA/CDA1 family)